MGNRPGLVNTLTASACAASRLRDPRGRDGTVSMLDPTEIPFECSFSLELLAAHLSSEGRSKDGSVDFRDPGTGMKACFDSLPVRQRTECGSSARGSSGVKVSESAPKEAFVLRDPPRCPRTVTALSGAIAWRCAMLLAL